MEAHHQRTLEDALDLLEQAGPLLASVDWSQVETRVKLEAVGRFASVITVLDATTVGLAGDLSRGKQVETAGWASAKDFLTAATGGHKGAGPGMVRLAKRLQALPRTAEAFGAGWLSLAKADVIAAKIATLPKDDSLRADAEALLLERARVLDATELGRCFLDVIARIDPDGTILGAEADLEAQERSAHHERTTHQGKTRGGGAWIRFQSTEEDIALITETLSPWSAPVKSEPGACGGNPTGASFKERNGTCHDTACDHDGADTREHGARMVDAMVEACRRLQAAQVLPESHGTPIRMVVTTDIDILRSGLVKRDIGGLLPNGDRLSVAAVRRLACDAEIIPVVMGSESQVLDLGRVRRLVSPGIWTALVVRDWHCAFPGCRRKPIACDAHHIVPWADGGPTSLANLVLLCGKHHTMLHQTPWQVRINPADGHPEFRPPPGRDGPRDWIRERPSHLLVA